LAAARFSLRFSLSVFCGCFFASFFGFEAPFIVTSGDADVDVLASIAVVIDVPAAQ
jgi:hypothetical protein